MRLFTSFDIVKLLCVLYILCSRWTRNHQNSSCDNEHKRRFKRLSSAGHTPARVLSTPSFAEVRHVFYPFCLLKAPTSHAHCAHRAKTSVGPHRPKCTPAVSTLNRPIGTSPCGRGHLQTCLGASIRARRLPASKRTARVHWSATRTIF